MKRLIDLVRNPSGFDSLSNYVGEIPESKYLVLLTRNRDSDLLTESNFDCALEALGGESESVEIFRFGHWACGWWEALCVVEGTAAAEEASKIFKALQDYPVLDDSDFCEREIEEANETWARCYTPKERIEYIRMNRSQFDFQSFADLRAQVRGEYFGGYASELIQP